MIDKLLLVLIIVVAIEVSKSLDGRMKKIRDKVIRVWRTIKRLGRRIKSYIKSIINKPK